MTSIVLADDHPLVRRGLRALLDAEPDFEVVGEAPDGLEAVSLVEHLKPHLLVVDLFMPALGGLEVTRRVTQAQRSCRVVVLSIQDNEAYVREALRNGASGYVLKEATEGELVQAVREAAAGRIYLSTRLSQRAVEAYALGAREAGGDAYDLLTSREREVLQLAAEGYSNPETAARLHISPRTVESHRASLMGKLALRTQSDLIRYAVRRGILKLNS